LQHRRQGRGIGLTDGPPKICGLRRFAKTGSWHNHTTQNGAKQSKVDVGRFKGLGEMMPAQLKETTMDPAKRSMLRVVLLADDRAGTADSVERLMGTKAEARFAFISDKAEFASEDLLDV
jgi:DNA gyrase/topoisomerase IV subunit B